MTLIVLIYLIFDKDQANQVYLRAITDCNLRSIFNLRIQVI